jgi:hypothetical protein
MRGKHGEHRVFVLVAERRMSCTLCEVSQRESSAASSTLEGLHFARAAIRL